MSDLELEQKAQFLARDIVSQARKAQCEAIDLIPRTLFTTGVVFLSIVVLLLYREMTPSNEYARTAFLSMILSVVSSALLFSRTVRISKEIIKQMRPVVQNGMWKEMEVPLFRWWEVIIFVTMSISFLCAIVLLACSVVHA